MVATTSSARLISPRLGAPRLPGPVRIQPAERCRLHLGVRHVADPGQPRQWRFVDGGGIAPNGANTKPGEVHDSPGRSTATRSPLARSTVPFRPRTISAIRGAASAAPRRSIASFPSANFRRKASRARPARPSGHSGSDRGRGVNTRCRLESDLVTQEARLRARGPPVCSVASPSHFPAAHHR